jgi:hypothetical protein
MKPVSTFSRTFFCSLILFSLWQCVNATKEELEAIAELNSKYSNCTFSPGSDLVGTHLNIQIGTNWDSLELKTIYDS